MGTWLPVVLCAAALLAITNGARQSMALFLGTLNTQTGLGIATVSLAFAIGQLMWGFTQPFAGGFADRYGSARVMLTGALLIALGTALIPFATSLPMLILSIGILAGGGAGVLGPSVVMGAVAQHISEARRGLATGIVNAGMSTGQFLIIPVAQATISSAGWHWALWGLSGLTLLAVPLILAFRAPAGGHARATSADTLSEAIGRASRDRSYLLLGAGFFVCGFHVAFIATHMPGVVAACGLPPEAGAWSLAVIGLFNIIGSLGIGWAVGRYRMKLLLSGLYAARGLAVLFFLLAPKTVPVLMIFSVIIGLTYLATVPPTAGLVAKLHGPRYMATLFGIVMFSHQIGGFLGAWLGGKAFESTGSYDWIWYADILLAVAAALVHLPIREAKPVRTPKPVAA